jgi:bifunctional non-homologous end joining protein LigD
MPRGADIKGVHWVKPQLVAEVAYTGITHDGLLRHPTFKGLRNDKPASDVVLEQPRAAESASQGPSKRKLDRRPAPSAAPPLTHPDKVLYPDLGITKRELYAYFEAVSAYMLPQVVNRPLTLVRCPEGSGKKCFFQKHPGASLAEGLRRVTVHASEGEAEYAAIEDERGLLSLVQMGVLEVHIWGAHADDSEHPDQLVFDLDPDTGLAFKDVIVAAHDMRALLEEYELESWVKTTGGKGLHVTVPIVPRAGWDEVKIFCRQLAEEMATRAPERYLASMSKAKRKGKVFIDYLRNGRGQTFVAPYSPRARVGAGIAMPVAWDELSAKFDPEAFNVRSAQKYLAKRKHDPFASLLAAKQQLPSTAPSAVSARGRRQR